MQKTPNLHPRSPHLRFLGQPSAGLPIENGRIRTYWQGLGNDCQMRFPVPQHLALATLQRSTSSPSFPLVMILARLLDPV